jgi:hypothetical protein
MQNPLKGDLNFRAAEHSKLYRRYTGIGDLRSISATSTKDVEVVSGLPQKIYYPNARRRNLDQSIAEIAEKSNLVVIATVSEQKSFLTAEGTFVFTDYSMTVDQVIKNNLPRPISVSSQLIVTRPGGTIRLNGHVVHAVDESLDPFQLGKRYLLFLEYISRTGGYEAFAADGAFLVDHNRTVKLTKEKLPSELEDGVDLAVLVQKVLARSN